MEHHARRRLFGFLLLTALALAIAPPAHALRPGGPIGGGGPPDIFDPPIFDPGDPPPPPEDVTFFESGVAPRTDTGFGLTVSDLIFVGHRFEVTRPTVLREAGGFFYSDSAAEAFVAVVALDGPDGLPEVSNLAGADLVTTRVVQIAAGLGEAAASFDLQLGPGWYMLVFGQGAFGADLSSPTLSLLGDWEDTDPSQPAISIPAPGGPVFAHETVVRVFATPEPDAALAAALALAALAPLSRARRSAARCRRGASPSPRA